MINENSSEIVCNTRVVFSEEEWSKIKEVRNIMEKHNLVIEIRASGGYYRHQEEGCLGHNQVVAEPSVEYTYWWHIFRGWNTPCLFDNCVEVDHHSHRVTTQQYKELEEKLDLRQSKKAIKELPRRPGDTGKFCLKCKLSNHNTGECYRKQCHHCKEWTHLSRNCRNKKKGKKRN
ncbi:6255_t:CDS:2 [Funneliformis caledonium]|uniref:6255_t:CDS:1 n=2 Tax=Funneliformis TaxID=1117308 RepID=A0A9N9NDA0_9GLOM|nr:10537_t:CDS:2 [Funneliformis mosseae]CAG8724017.1 6255_t:CDS:2 [Funneliformis caledonium]